jgi:hypothetical protein
MIPVENTAKKGNPNLSQTVLKEIGLKNVPKIVALTRIYKYESKHFRPIFVIGKNVFLDLLKF